MLRDLARVYGPAALLVVVGLLVAYHFVPPAPRTHLVMATGTRGDPYYAYGLSYRDELASQGITLELRNTAGAVENLHLLQDPAATVDIAFTQGGIKPLEGGAKVRAIASVFLEPLWLFTRVPLDAERVTSLKGLRLAVGETGSGTREFVEELLTINGLSTADVTLLPLADRAAVSALRAGEVDVVAVATIAADPVIMPLASVPGVRLISLERTNAYVQHFSYLREVTLYQGALDFAHNVPDRDIRMLAPVVALVARSDLHPALVNVLAEAALEIHSQGDLFTKPREFPTATHPEIPTIRGAREYFDRGPSFLERWLPFWAASLVERSLVLLVPLLTVLLPLARVLPRAIDWRIRSRAFRWYRQLRAIEHDARKLLPGDADTRAALQHRLDEVERRVLDVSMPPSRSDLLYNLRQHLDLVRARLAAPLPGSTASVRERERS